MPRRPDEAIARGRRGQLEGGTSRKKAAARSRPRDVAPDEEVDLQDETVTPARRAAFQFRRGGDQSETGRRRNRRSLARSGSGQRRQTLG